MRAAKVPVMVALRLFIPENGAGAGGDRSHNRSRCTFRMYAGEHRV